MKRGATAPSSRHLLRERETGALDKDAFLRQFQFAPDHVRELRLERTLKGHEGCVNRLAWNAEGTLLASGSDDKKVIIWPYMDKDRSPIAVDTRHSANIFGVNFLPCTGDKEIVTGAMDKEVRLHTLDALPNRRLPQGEARSGASNVIVVPSDTRVFRCHTERVKQVAVEPRDPNVFFSASEDGSVRMFDKRMRTQDMNNADSKNVLLTVKTKNGLLQLKSLSINTVRPWQMAVGSADQYVRVYDWRSLGTGNLDSVEARPMLKLAPPHMCLAGHRPPNRQPRFRPNNATFVSFGNRGDKVVVTYHGDHAYSFSTLAAAEDARGTAFCGVGPLPYLANRSPGSGGGSDGHPRLHAPESPVKIVELPHTKVRREVLPEAAELLKTVGNQRLFENRYSDAITAYSEAIEHKPTSAQLHALRSDALLKRNWDGDAWFALEDAHRAMHLDPGNLKAQTRAISSLRSLGQLKAARSQAELARERFPGEEREILPLLQSIQSDIAHRTQMAQDRRLGRQGDPERQGRLGRDNRSMLLSSADSPDPFAVQPVVPASAVESPEDTQHPTGIGGRTVSSPPIPPPPPPPAPPPPYLTLDAAMSSAQAARSAMSVSEGEAMSISLAEPEGAGLSREASAVEVSSGISALPQLAPMSLPPGWDAPQQDLAMPALPQVSPPHQQLQPLPSPHHQPHPLPSPHHQPPPLLTSDDAEDLFRMSAGPSRRESQPPALLDGREGTDRIISGRSRGASGCSRGEVGLGNRSGTASAEPMLMEPGDPGFPEASGGTGDGPQGSAPPRRGSSHTAPLVGGGGAGGGCGGGLGGDGGGSLAPAVPSIPSAMSASPPLDPAGPAEDCAMQDRDGLAGLGSPTDLPPRTPAAAFLDKMFNSASSSKGPLQAPRSPGSGRFSAGVPDAKAGPSGSAGRGGPLPAAPPRGHAAPSDLCLPSLATSEAAGPRLPSPVAGPVPSGTAAAPGSSGTAAGPVSPGTAAGPVSPGTSGVEGGMQALQYTVAHPHGAPEPEHHLSGHLASPGTRSPALPGSDRDPGPSSVLPGSSPLASPAARQAAPHPLRSVGQSASASPFLLRTLELDPWPRHAPGSGGISSRHEGRALGSELARRSEGTGHGPSPVPARGASQGAIQAEGLGMRARLLSEDGTAELPGTASGARVGPPALHPGGLWDRTVGNVTVRHSDGSTGGPAMMGISADLSDSDDDLDSDSTSLADSGDDEGWGGDAADAEEEAEEEEEQDPIGALIGSAGPGRLAMLQRYIGHCNVHTDIKEAVFLGDDDAYVAAGSDCGHVFIYDAHSGDVVRVLLADDEVANCVQPHPTLPVLATSGIEEVVDLWSPFHDPDRPLQEDTSVKTLTEKNQERVKRGPHGSFQTAMNSMVHPRVLQAISENPNILNYLMTRGRNHAAMDEDDEGPNQVGCRIT